MNRLLPRTLFGQMLVILLGGLLMSHLLGWWIYASDRAQAVRAVGGYAATQRIANLARLVDEAPPDWRDRIVVAANDPTLRVTLTRDPPTEADDASDDDDVPIRRYLAAQLPDPLAAHVRVAVAPLPPPFLTSHHHMPFHPWSGPDRWWGRPRPWRSLDASVQLSDGAWLNFSAGIPPGAPSASWQFVVSMVVMAGIVVLAGAWAVRRVTAPLGVIAAAAERLGRDVNASPVAEAGSREMRQAAVSFNQMQTRLQRLLENRTRMLAALSHDLRTPLTLLRLRTEALPEGEERERMLATLGEVDAMVAGSLEFARGQSVGEPVRRIDLTALLGSIVDDLTDAGLPVTLAAAPLVVLDCQPGALRRAFGNLIDNALKYGGVARLAVDIAPDIVRVVVDDDGPGIPVAEQSRVFEPFYRLEASRSRETGGSGLGLAIALSVVQAHGGTIELANRPAAADGTEGGGLRVTVTLPR